MRRVPSGTIGCTLAALSLRVVERRQIQTGDIFLHKPVNDISTQKRAGFKSRQEVHVHESHLCPLADGEELLCAVGEFKAVSGEGGRLGEGEVDDGAPRRRQFPPDALSRLQILQCKKMGLGCLIPWKISRNLCDIFSMNDGLLIK